MLDYAIIGARNEKVGKYGKHDELIAFLQSCSCLPQFIAFVLARLSHEQAIPSLPLPPLRTSLQLRLMHQSPMTPTVLIRKHRASPLLNKC